MKIRDILNEVDKYVDSEVCLWLDEKPKIW